MGEGIRTETSYWANLPIIFLAKERFLSGRKQNAYGANPT
jgi:hypothetical protein